MPQIFSDMSMVSLFFFNLKLLFSGPKHNQVRNI